MALVYESDFYNGFERGSYTFTPEQRKAFRLIVDVEILSRVGPAHYNERYPVPQTFFGYGQIFYGTSNQKDVPLQYGRQRVLDVINWQTLISQLDRRQNLFVNECFAWLARATIEIEGAQPLPPESFEVFSIRETQIKINTEYQCAFTIFVNWLSLDLLFPYQEIQDTDDSDPSDDKPEYPEPQERPAGSPIPPGFQRTPPNSLNDPRDYRPGDANLSLWGTLITYSAEAWDGSKFIRLTETLSLAGYRPGVSIEASDSPVPGGSFQGKQTYFGLIAKFPGGGSFGPFNNLAGYTKSPVIIVSELFIPPN